MIKQYRFSIDFLPVHCNLTIKKIMGNRMKERYSSKYAIASVMILTAAFLSGTSQLAAEGRNYIGLGLGIMTDLGGLGKTITVDGLSSSTAYSPSYKGAAKGKPCEEAPDPVACKTGIPGVAQDVIVPENELITYKRATGGIISADTNGSMTGGVINGYYEHEWENKIFVRTGASYVRKIMGGHTESKAAGIEWLNITWDYKALYVPVHIGMKVGDKEGTQMYGAVGVTYFDGGFTIGGKNIGDIPGTMLGIQIGAQTSLDPVTGQPAGGPLLYENVNFKAHGFGFTSLLGVENRLSNGDAIFLEVNHITAGSQGRGNTQDIGGARHMSSHPTYPVVLNGTFFSVGYKIGI
jgi:hypothetical protein